MSSNYRDELYGTDSLTHFGVIGMRWGIRRYQPYSVKPRGSGKTGSEVGDAARYKSRRHMTKEELKADVKAKKNPNDVYKHKDLFSDQELRELTNRMNTEAQVRSLSRKPYEQAKRDLGTILGITTTSIALGVAGTKIYKNRASIAKGATIVKNNLKPSAIEKNMKNFKKWATS